MPETRPNVPTLPALLVPEREAAKLLGGLSIKGMYNLRQRGLPYVKVGARTMYSPADLAQWVARQKTVSVGAAEADAPGGLRDEN